MTDSPPFVLVVNPRAGAGRAARRLPRLEAALRARGASFETRRTTGQGDATRLVREAIAEGAAGVAVVGGDGTMNEAVNGFFEPNGAPTKTETWLGPLPCGTGGDFQRVLQIPHDSDEMASRLLETEPRPVDVGWLSYTAAGGERRGRAFINIASFGVAGLVDELVNAGPKWLGGKPAFLLATVRGLAKWRRRTARVVVDGKPFYEGPITNVVVANGQYFGGGMRIAAKALVDDGLFEVIAVPELGVAEQARLLPHLYRGTLVDQPGIASRRGKRVVAEPTDDVPAPIPLDVDGETPGGLPAVFELRAGAVRLRA